MAEPQASLLRWGPFRGSNRAFLPAEDLLQLPRKLLRMQQLHPHPSITNLANRRWKGRPAVRMTAVCQVQILPVPVTNLAFVQWMGFRLPLEGPPVQQPVGGQRFLLRPGFQATQALHPPFPDPREPPLFLLAVQEQEAVLLLWRVLLQKIPGLLAAAIPEFPQRPVHQLRHRLWEFPAAIRGLLPLLQEMTRLGPDAKWPDPPHP